MAKENINPGLKKLATSLDDLRPDPNNARSHGGRSIEAIASSLREFGQQKPIIALDDGTVIAGNGTLEAARSLGWSKLAVIRFADAAKARAYALADNRTAELSEWDPARLAENLDAIAAEFSGWSPDSFGFSSDDVSSLLTAASDTRNRTDDDQPVGVDQSASLSSTFAIVIECATEQEQVALIERFLAEGIKCRALI